LEIFASTEGECPKWGSPGEYDRGECPGNVGHRKMPSLPWSPRKILKINVKRPNIVQCWTI